MTALQLHCNASCKDEIFLRGGGVALSDPVPVPDPVPVLDPDPVPLLELHCNCYQKRFFWWRGLPVPVPDPVPVGNTMSISKTSSETSTFGTLKQNWNVLNEQKFLLPTWQISEDFWLEQT